MIVKANIRVYGNVQRIGYKIVIKNIARMLKGWLGILKTALSRSLLKLRRMH